MVFGFDSVEGYTGLLTGRKAAVVYTSAVYGPGRPPSFGTDGGALRHSLIGFAMNC